MENGIKISATGSIEELGIASNTIKAILCSGQDQETMQSALDCLRSFNSVPIADNITISGCTFVDKKRKGNKNAPPI